MQAARLGEAALAAALLVAAGAALAAPAARPQDPGAPGAGGALRISAEPSRLLLGRDAAAALRISTPPDVEDVSLTASVGRVEGLRRVPGGFVARYRPPGEHFPQVAIVAAVGRTPHGSEHGWLAIPLSGQGDARVRTAPGQEITLQIGDQRFGPKRAGADGVAVIPVVVPPGVREAHQGFRPIALPIPESPLLHAVLERGTVLADRTERVRVFAYVVAPHGAARRGDVPVFEPSRGSVSVVEKEPGAVEATWTLPPGRAGEERLVVKLPAAPASRALLKLEAVAGSPAVVALSFDREAIVAGAADAVKVTARVFDAAGNQVPAALTLDAEGGALTDVRQVDATEVEARVRAGPVLGGRKEVRVTAVAPGLGLSGARALPLRPGEPAVTRFEEADGVLRADGSRVTVLRVAVADRNGNPVDAPPVVTAERGKVLGVAPASPGVFDVRYLAPAVASPTRERLVATAGGVRATASPLLLAPPTRYELSPSAGFLVDLRRRAAVPSAGVAVDAPTEWRFALERGFVPAVRLEVDALGLESGTSAAFLGGATLAHGVGLSGSLRASAAAGMLMLPAGRSAAARLAFGSEMHGQHLSPYAEVSILGVGHGPQGMFAAVGIALGLRITLERPHGDDPHRR